MNNPILALDAVTSKWEVPSYSIDTDGLSAGFSRLLSAGQLQRYASLEELV